MADIRKEFVTEKWGTAISREDFEKAFTKTKEKVTFTMQGWDGKSYDGETRTAYILKTDIKGFEDRTYVKVGRHIHEIDFERTAVEKATGIAHPVTIWILEVLPR